MTDDTPTQNPAEPCKDCQDAPAFLDGLCDDCCYAPWEDATWG